MEGGSCSRCGSRLRASHIRRLCPTCSHRRSATHIRPTHLRQLNGLVGLKSYDVFWQDCCQDAPVALIR
eukprot:7528530-Pyramimonas_sp.AAC.1